MKARVLDEVTLSVADAQDDTRTGRSGDVIRGICWEVDHLLG
jgi:hypothetical protein